MARKTKIQGFLYDVARGMRGDVRYLDELMTRLAGYGYCHGQSVARAISTAIGSGVGRFVCGTSGRSNFGR